MDLRAVACYFVLYRLTQRGYSAAITTSARADIMACTQDGSRVAMVRVRARERGKSFALSAADREPPGRNLAYAFVDFADGDSHEPRCFVLPGALVARRFADEPRWPDVPGSLEALAEYRDAWELLGLDRERWPRSSPSVHSSPPLS